MCCARQHLDTEQVKRRNKKKGGCSVGSAGQWRRWEQIPGCCWDLSSSWLFPSTSLGSFVPLSLLMPPASPFPIWGWLCPVPLSPERSPGRGRRVQRGEGKTSLPWGWFWFASSSGKSRCLVLPLHTQMPAVAAAVLPPGIMPVSGVLRQGCCMNNAVMRRL